MTSAIRSNNIFELLSDEGAEPLVEEVKKTQDKGKQRQPIGSQKKSTTGNVGKTSTKNNKAQQKNREAETEQDGGNWSKKPVRGRKPQYQEVTRNEGKYHNRGGNYQGGNYHGGGGNRGNYGGNYRGGNYQGGNYQGGNNDDKSWGGEQDFGSPNFDRPQRSMNRKYPSEEPPRPRRGRQYDRQSGTGRDPTEIRKDGAGKGGWGETKSGKKDVSSLDEKDEWGGETNIPPKVEVGTKDSTQSAPTTEDNENKTDKEPKTSDKDEKVEDVDTSLGWEHHLELQKKKKDDLAKLIENKPTPRVVVPDPKVAEYLSHKSKQDQTNTSEEKKIDAARKGEKAVPINQLFRVRLPPKPLVVTEEDIERQEARAKERAKEFQAAKEAKDKDKDKEKEKGKPEGSKGSPSVEKAAVGIGRGGNKGSNDPRYENRGRNNEGNRGNNDNRGNRGRGNRGPRRNYGNSWFDATNPDLFPALGTQ
eukprot:TRINITY_DN124_c0_g1_i1.p1 TRINITY_DN124_c0_g1~~TRINITY_DN124_c0_g1_i1.p1  ORF type:complete len:475 (-),score=152.71 TRINITY_DN124_c0_g1_i1:75-1499(-)